MRARDGSASTADVAAAYVCVLSNKRGKFLPQRAKELGVKPCVSLCTTTLPA
jgi:hypothetical protein